MQVAWSDEQHPAAKPHSLHGALRRGRLHAPRDPAEVTPDHHHQETPRHQTYQLHKWRWGPQVIIIITNEYSPIFHRSPQYSILDYSHPPASSNILFNNWSSEPRVVPGVRTKPSQFITWVSLEATKRNSGGEQHLLWTRAPTAITATPGSDYGDISLCERVTPPVNEFELMIMMSE